jgi:hypothetical protein
LEDEGVMKLNNWHLFKGGVRVKELENLEAIQIIDYTNQG